MKTRTISNKRFLEAKQNPDNIRIIKRACAKFKEKLDTYTLQACGDIGLWECIKNYKKDRKTKFTTFLYQSVIWECIREYRMIMPQSTSALNENSAIYTPTESTQLDNTDLVNHILKRISQKERYIIILRFFYNYTYDKIAKLTGYSKSGIKKILDRTLCKMVYNIEED